MFILPLTRLPAAMPQLRLLYNTAPPFGNIPGKTGPRNLLKTGYFVPGRAWYTCTEVIARTEQTMQERVNGRKDVYIPGNRIWIIKSAEDDWISVIYVVDICYICFYTFLFKFQHDFSIILALIVEEYYKKHLYSLVLYRVYNIYL